MLMDIKECGCHAIDSISNLEGATNYFFRDGALYIDLKFDTGTMRFSANWQK